MKVQLEERRSNIWTSMLRLGHNRRLKRNSLDKKPEPERLRMLQIISRGKIRWPGRAINRKDWEGGRVK